MNRAPVYLDNAASTAPDARVAALMNEVLSSPDGFGNPSSSHAYGAKARARIAIARAQVAAVDCEPDDVIFTSGATEADNLALFGVTAYYRNRGRHLLTSRTEHKAVAEAARSLEKQGWQVGWLTPGPDGRIQPQQVAEALRDDTVLASIMHVNNETGAINDIAAIAARCQARGVPLHVDAAQSLGKLPMRLAEWGVALASLAAHKAHGPKGAGALVLRRASGVQIAPLSHGGGQESGLRSGTLATHQIAGMGLAAELADREGLADLPRLRELSARLEAQLCALGAVLRNAPAQACVPHILSLSFQGVEGESLLAAVSDAIAVSTGSACDSAHADASYVLRALGRDARLAEATLRFGLSRFTTDADIGVAVQAVGTAVARLRAVSGFAPPAQGAGA